MRLSVVSLATVVALSLSTVAFAADFELDAAGIAGSIPKGESSVIAESGGMKLLSVGPQQRESVRHLLAEGGGGDVADLTTLQVAFSDPADGNVVLMLWDEPTANPDGVAVLFNGGVLGVLPDGAGGVNITGVPAGTFEFAVQAVHNPESLSVATQIVVSDQPFSDAVGLNCGPGDIEGPDACAIVAEWDNPGPLPDNYVVLLNGNLLGELPGDALGVNITGAPPGGYTITVIGFSDAADGNGGYRGSFVETSCVLTCEPIDVPALGPFAGVLLLVCIGALGAWRLRRRTVGAAA